MDWRLARSILFVILALVVLGVARAQTTVLRGGAVYTLDPARPWARAVVVQDGRIVYVGDERGAAPYERGARVVAIDGRMVLPGFQDSHTHLIAGGLRLIRCRLQGLATAAAIYAEVRACAAKDKSAWLRGSGWSREAFGPKGPSREALDAIVGDRPALLTTEDGFTAWVNSRALAAGGVTGSSGVVEDDVYERIRAQAPKPTPVEFRAALIAASAMANRFGITSVVDAGASSAAIDAYHAADQANALTLRVVAAQVFDTSKRALPRAREQVGEMMQRRDAVKGPRFRADAAKIYLDGEFDRRTAAMMENYAGMPASAGGAALEPGDMFAVVKDLDEQNFLIHVHAMGDRAVRLSLDAIEMSVLFNAARDRRHQLAHVGLVEPKHVPRFGRIGAAANFQPAFFHADDPAAAKTAAVLGPERAGRLFPIRSIAATNGRLLISSDWPAPTMNPLEIIQYALTRQPLDRSKPPQQPNERITLDQALTAYTINAAWASRDEANTGSIVVGKAADLIVVDRNLFETPVSEIHRARVLLTLIDGEAVYRDPQLMD